VFGDRGNWDWLPALGQVDCGGIERASFQSQISQAAVFIAENRTWECSLSFCFILLPTILKPALCLA
jgi:hypothetical protein